MPAPAEHGPPPIRIRVRLTACSLPRDGPRLWVMVGDDAAVTTVFRLVSQSVLHRFTFARVTSASGTRLVAKADSSARDPALPLPFAEYTAEPKSNLFLPPGLALTPHIPHDRLQRVFGLRTGDIAWVEDGSVVHRIAASAFLPLEAFVEYTVPVATTRTDARSPSPLFTPPAFVLEQPARTRPPVTVPTLPANPRPWGGWVGRLRTRIFGTTEKSKQLPKKRATNSGQGVRSPPASGLAPRVAPDERVLRETLPKLFAASPTARARAWATLAEHCTSPADAAVCWMNAVWESSSPPAAWLSAWVQAERAAGNAARLAATEAIAAGFGVPAVEPLRQGDAKERRLPVRMAWLVRVAVNKLHGPDVLAASRCHDRLFARLTRSGPVFGADVPWFVGCPDEVEAARHEQARLWLLGFRPLVRGWLRSCYLSDHRLRPYTRPSFRATLAAADRILARAALRLGDPDTGRKWSRRKVRVTPPPPPNTDLLALLGSDEFASRLRRVLREGETNDVRYALALAAAEPTAQFLPRAVLAAAERAVDESILSLIPRAIDLLPEAVRVIGGESDAGRVLLIRLLSRTIRSACRLAESGGRWTAIEPTVRCLIDHLHRGDEVVAEVVTNEADRLARTFRVLDAPALSAKLFAAVKRPDTPLVHFLRGDPRVGLTTLNNLRNQLVSPDGTSERNRHRLALWYVAAVRHVPPDDAQNRVSELFRTLGPYLPPTAADDRIWLPAVELIDRAVTAAVGGDLPLPAVRTWLDEYAHLTRTRIARDLERLLTDAPRS